MREAEELRALLAVMRVELDALLLNTEVGEANGEMDVEDPAPATSEPPPPSAAVPAEAVVAPPAVTAAHAGGPAGAQLEPASWPDSWPAEPRSEPLPHELVELRKPKPVLFNGAYFNTPFSLFFLTISSKNTTSHTCFCMPTQAKHFNRETRINAQQNNWSKCEIASAATEWN